jgi:RimJ/RimL family protein N-acetyltransferase
VVFDALRTERLLLRAPSPSDTADLHSRRNDADIARYQDWLTPYPLDRAEALVTESTALDGPTPGHWWMITIADPTDTTVLGDLALHLTADAHTAEVGYTLSRTAWGHGYATEAVGALVAHLFDTVGVTRVEGKLHPDNLASAMVLERVGMLFEGHTKLSFWLGDDNSDDWIYGMTRGDWEAWRDRPHRRPSSVRLVEIDADSMGDVRRLTTHKSQERFVAPVSASYGDALFPEVIDGAPVAPWMRAIEADGALVGFVMVALTTDVHPEPYLWRLLIDRRHQRRGIGTATLDLLVEQCRAWGDRALTVSWVPGKGSPDAMYLRYGFEPTGTVLDGELEGRLAFES